MVNGVSVIICCYNSAARIEKTLEHLAVQIIDGIACEIILVDNASVDNTAEIVRLGWSKTGHSKITLNIVSEPMPGLSSARLKGISASAYEFLIFCDDDNWLDKNYLKNVYNLFNENTNVAIIGGFGTAKFENELLKPFWFETFHSGYAVSMLSGEQEYRDTVFGAGMAIRKSVLKTVTGNYPLLLNDREKDQLSAGGDSEICMRVRLAGYHVLYSPQLKFIHFLPTNRLTWQYLKRLHIGFANTHVILNLYNKALTTENSKLPSFYWLKKALYYSGIYIKYWPKHYKVYSKGSGTMDEIHHIIWKHIALNYFEYNFKTIGIYRTVRSFKKSYHIA